MSYRATRFPYIALGLDAKEPDVPQLGGITAKFTAAADLKVGDVVFVSAAQTVNKSNTQANYATFAGVVVGGVSLLDGCVVIDDLNCIGAIVPSGTQALVQTSGIARVVADAAITVGTRISQGATTAGRVDDTAFTAGQMCGIALDAATNAGDVISMLIQAK